jgi:hypothetical protein
MLVSAEFANAAVVMQMSPHANHDNHDDALYESAVEAADPGMDKANLVREAMKVFVRVQAAQRRL